MPTDLQIYILGSFRLLVSGSAVSSAAWQKRRAKLIIQILSLRPERRAHREELIDILFPETDEQTANARFCRVLHSARKALEPNHPSYTSSKYLITEGQQIRLAASEDLWIDAEEFSQKARKGLKTNDLNLLESAAELYQGDLLADEPFETWLLDRRERLRTLFHSVLRRLAEITEHRGNMEEAHFWLDKILELETADEKAHQAKMRLFLDQGERCLALSQYERCAEILRQELAVKPDLETEKLKQKIIAAEGE
jgi:DNA-binding SARP family transcriptional activator